MSSIDEFRRYILQFRAEKGKTCTHTSIREPAARLYIPDEKLDEFFQMYRKAMVNRVPLHFTEKPTPNSPMRVDLDFRFKLHNEGDGLSAPAQPGKLVRQYLPSDVRRIVKAYFEVLLEYVEVSYDHMIAYILEKPAPMEYRGKMKDGIHIIFPYIVVDNAFQYLVRNHIIERGAELFDPLGLSNSYDDVVDEAIIENSNWQMYGSCKPNCDAYRVTGIYKYDPNDDDATETSSIHSKPGELYRPPITPIQNKNGRLESLPLPDAAQDLECVSLLSMRNKTDQTPYHDHKQGEVIDYIRRVLPSIDDRRKSKLHAQIFGKHTNQTKNTVPDDEFKLAQQLMDECISSSRAERYDDWIKIGWCLRNIDYRLLNAWIKLSRVSSKYVEGECQKLWDMMRIETLGMGTLRWWARQDNKNRYEEIIDGNVLTLIDKCTGSDGAHFDIARVVHAMYKDRYRFTCKEIWYAFDETKHRWVRSREGIKLRTILSTEVCTKFLQRSIHYTELAMRDADNRATYDEKAKKLIDIAKKLKLSNFKASVMTECKCLFTDEKFEELLDSHPHLLGFENGVYDMRMHEFRDGLPDDYISFSTNIDYTRHDTKSQEVADIHNFFEKVFMNPDVRRYMWDILSMALDGGIRIERFFVCTGSGSNGKSRIYDLFQKAIGDYYCILPVSLITQKRAASNAAQSELERTKGRRFAVMQEPGENEKINIGLMKELTGGDRILARGLFKEPIEFRPQFKMVLTCNELPEVPSDDGGTWRRIRVIEFKSKFVEKPSKPNEFPLDVELSDKFENWAPVFMSMLLEHHKLVDPKNIPEPSDVRIATESYKKNNDVVGQYVEERLEPVNDRKKRLKLQETFVDFKSWAMSNIPKGKKVPDRNQLRAYIERSYGPYNNIDGWKCIQFRNGDKDALTKAEESDAEDDVPESDVEPVEDVEPKKDKSKPTSTKKNVRVKT
jgi:P4 family phage/plasmid primase-like protien